MQIQVKGHNNAYPHTKPLNTARDSIPHLEDTFQFPFEDDHLVNETHVEVLTQ